MGLYSALQGRVTTDKPLPAGYSLKLEASPIPLLLAGLSFPVTVMAASTLRTANPGKEFKTLTVMGHFDTGASVTTIDTKIADYLELLPAGVSKTFTAAGAQDSAQYAIDVLFPGSQLKPFINLRAGSCTLPLVLDRKNPNYLFKNNIGVLIGRDIMSRWNIVWNGPTSTVFISD